MRTKRSNRSGGEKAVRAGRAWGRGGLADQAGLSRPDRRSTPTQAQPEWHAEGVARPAGVRMAMGLSMQRQRSWGSRSWRQNILLWAVQKHYL